MLAQIADLRLCALQSLRPYVLGPLCPCDLMSALLCPAHFCLRPNVVDRPYGNQIPKVFAGGKSFGPFAS